MTVTWQPVTSSWFGTCLVADCGLWMGTPTPPIPYPPWFPPDPNLGEIDFVVGLPNPNGQVQDFRNGSYSAPNVADSWKYLDSSNWLGTGGGYAAALDVGSHLFVVWYPTVYYPNPLNIPTPSVEPLVLVPAELAAGGLIKAAPGAAHWSGWLQDPPEQVWSVGYRGIGEAQEQVHGSSGYVTSFQHSAEIAQAKAEAQLVWGGDVDWGVLASNKFSAGRVEDKYWVEDGGAISWPPGYEGSNWDDSISRSRSGQQLSAPIDWATQRWNLPVGLYYLKQGYDYGIIPGADPLNEMSYIQYENAATPADVGNLNTFVGWTDTNYKRGYTGIIDLSLTITYQASTFDSRFTGTARFEYYDGGFTSTPHTEVLVSNAWNAINKRNANLSGLWPRFGGGTLIGTRPFTVSGASGDITFPSPSQSRFMLAAAVEAIPPVVVNVNGFGTGTISSTYYTLKNTPQPYIQKPRYRYWIPAGSAIPMRQRQRDDGLSTDTRQEKGHGSSLQSSLRRSSRTYY